MWCKGRIIFPLSSIRSFSKKKREEEPQVVLAFIIVFESLQADEEAN